MTEKMCSRDSLRGFLDLRMYVFFFLGVAIIIHIIILKFGYV